MTNDNEIIIEKDDVVPYIYFVCSMAQRGRMYGGINGKSDYIGGIFDRWINIIPESVIFNKYLLPKIASGLKVISDYYEYNPKKSKIAPDVLGVQIGEVVRPFVEYVNEWRALPGAPQIEVKSFKKAQYMVSLRNQGYDNKYLVMAETKLDSDYLLPFFESAVVSDEVYNRLKMDDAIFIKSNENGDLSPITKVSRHNTNLGTLKLITVCSALDFMSFSTLCSANQSPIYVKEIRKTRFISNLPETKPFANIVHRNSNGLYSLTSNILDGNTQHKLLDFHIENLHNINFVKKSRSSITIITTGVATINDSSLDANSIYIIKFQLLDRSSNNGEEYFMSKSIIDKIPNQEADMLEAIRHYIE